MQAISIRSRGNQSWKRGLEASIIVATTIESFRNIQRSFIPWARLSRRIRASGTEKVFLVKQSTELKRGTMKAGNQKQWAIVDRRSPLASLVSFRFQFRVSSPRCLITASFSSLRETSNDQTNFHTLKGRRCFSPRVSPLPSFVLTSKIDPRLDEETIEKIVRRIVRRNHLRGFGSIDFSKR